MATETGGICPNCFSFRYKEGQCLDCGYVEDRRDFGQALSPGTLLGNRYLIGRVLGIGGFGITYKAFDSLYRQICAIKEFVPAGLSYRHPGELELQVHGNSALPYFQHGMQRFIEEAQVLKRLENVPSVVEVKECFQENQTAYFVMEFLDGTNLKTVIKATQGAISAEDITRIIALVGNAMAVIHRSTGILHRDISPDNIYLLKNGAVKLLDFGSARQQIQDERQEFTVEFKKGFAPPEQYSRSGKQGPYTDVYALASTYYYALTGVMVPDAMSRLNDQTYVPLFQMRGDISRQVSQTVDKALELDYRRRIQNMEDFVRGIGMAGPVGGDVLRSERTPHPYLQVVSGIKAGIRWQLPVNTDITIGRSPKRSNIVIDGIRISKSHCKLFYRKETGEFYLTDLNSTNGVRVGGRTLEPGRTYQYPSEVQFSLAGGECIIKAGVSYEE